MSGIRPVDKAMQLDRPEKQYIRNLWASEIEGLIFDGNHPLYLTLPGLYCKDIELLAKRGIIKLTETGGIHPDDFGKIVAIESSLDAAIKIRQKHSGLDVKVLDVKSLVRGDNQKRFPDNDDEIMFCKAMVVNLDLNEKIAVPDGSHGIFIPVIEWIKKFCLLHKDDNMDWTLCLTLHGEIQWDNEVNKLVSRFFIDNFDNEPEFEKKFKELLGEDILNQVNSVTIDFTDISQSDTQKILMVLIPKILVQYATVNGWVLETTHNYYYQGGTGAPMITWVFHFTLDAYTTSKQNRQYKEGLKQIFNNIGFINGEGKPVVI